MKKTLKITGITLLSLLALILIIAAIACWLIFTPTRLTPIVNKVTDKVITCDTEIGNVNLTFFKSFPDLGISINDVILINPTEGAPTDTVASLKELNVAVDVKAFLKEQEIVVKGLTINNGKACLFTSAEGLSNYDIFPHNENEKKDTASFDISSLTASLDNIHIHDLSAYLIDKKSDLEASAEGLDLTMKGGLKKGDINADIATSLQNAVLGLGGKSPLRISVNEMGIKANAKAKDTNGSAKADIQLGTVNFSTSDIAIGMNSMKLNATADKTGDEWTSNSLSLLAKEPLFNLAGSTPISINAEQLNITLPYAHLAGKEISCSPVITLPHAFFSLDNEPWVNGSDVNIGMCASTNTDFDKFRFTDGIIRLEDIELTLDGDLDLTDSTRTSVNAHVISNHLNAKKVLSMLPHSIQKSLPNIAVHKAGLAIDMAADFSTGNEGFVIHTADGGIKLDKVDVVLNDSMAFATPDFAITVKAPAATTTKQFKEFLQGTLASSTLDATITGLGRASLTALNGIFSLSDITDGKIPFSAKTKLSINSLNADLDTIKGTLGRTSIEALTTISNDKRALPQYTASLKTDAIQGHFGTIVTAATQALSLNASATYDKSKTNILDQWNPNLFVNLMTGHVELGMFPEPIEVPHIQFAFTPGKFNIEESRLQLGKSDFQLKGDIYNLNEFIDKTGLLTAQLDFTSNYTDVSEIMNLVSGLGNAAEDSVSVASEASSTDNDTSAEEDNPFMVPTGADIQLRTDIKTASWNGFDFHNVGGRVTCHDGVLVMEELGFTSKAATMQLTAMYKSPRKNHLFMGLDFHLIDVEIPDLIDLIPAVDTIVPMLKEFDGQAQFHLAGESYLKSNYDLKMSTLRGAATIEGKDLIVLPSSTFGTIKKYLMTDKSTENKIDSIDVEMAVFRDEVDVYPFRVRLGQYEAIVGGRHNINKDLDFNYHLSVTDTPLPVRLGLDVSGTLDDMKFKIAPCKYDNLYKPEKRGEVQTRALELKKVINESLKRNVKPVEYFDK